MSFVTKSEAVKISEANKKPRMESFVVDVVQSEIFNAANNGLFNCVIREVPSEWIADVMAMLEGNGFQCVMANHVPCITSIEHAESIRNKCTLQIKW